MYHIIHSKINIGQSSTTEYHTSQQAYNSFLTLINQLTAIPDCQVWQDYGDNEKILDQDDRLFCGKCSMCSSIYEQDDNGINREIPDKTT